MPDTPYPHTDRELIRLIERSPSHRAGYKQLIRELGLGGGRERRLLLEQLARITLRGDLVKIDEGQWSLPRATPQKSARSTADQSASADARRPMHTTREGLVAGRLDLHRDGFGFVRPNGAKDRADDLFIPPNELNGAMQGDEVLVDEAPPGRDGRRSGRIARVLTRRNPTVVGIFHYARGNGYRGSEHDPYTSARFNFIKPLDERMTQPVMIPNGPDGAPVLPPASSQHRVLGEEAQLQLEARVGTAPTSSQPFADPTEKPVIPSDGQRPQPRDPEEASLAQEDRTTQPRPTDSSHPKPLPYNPDLPHPLEGLAVDVEITDFPGPNTPARGRILEVLGHPDDFGVDVEIVIRKHHLPYQFPANVLAEAARSAQQTVDTLSDEALSHRHDFRGLPIVTIDGETARDFDDAVLVQPLPNGNWQLQVHIADVSHYVQPGTALDLEARLRGTSVYFPDRAVPMLPPALSSGMCSLRPDEDRLVLSCIAEIDAQGEVVDYQLCEGIIRSARRMTYTQVQAVLDTMEPVSEDATPDQQALYQQQLQTRIQFLELAPAFEQMYALALKLNRKRHRRGSIDFDLPEPVIRFDPQGNMAAITRSERGWSNRLIEEFMLTANECVAHWLEALGPSIYRIHELPDAKRILDFEEVASGYGQTLGFSSLPVKKLTMKTDRRSSRADSNRYGTRARAPQSFEVPESIPVTPQMYQKLTARIAGTPEERILSFLMLRSLKQARYSEKNEGHFALASPSYTHFTSPIRRYPDLIVHRLLRAALRAGANPLGDAILSTDPQPWSGKRQPRTPATRQTSDPGAPSFRIASPRKGEVSFPAGNDRTPLTQQNAGHFERRAEPAAEEPRSSLRSHVPPDHSANNIDPAVAPDATANTEPPFTLPAEELASIALESSQSERRADDAERELMEWKKIKFMEPRIGEDFQATVLSCTKYGFYVELKDLFIEGMVPIQTLTDSLSFQDQERFVFRDTDRVIVGAQSGRIFKLGMPVHVILNGVDRPNRRLQFILVPKAVPQSQPARSLRKSKRAIPGSEPTQPSPTRTGKPRKAKIRTKAKKSKGKRR